MLMRVLYLLAFHQSIPGTCVAPSVVYQVPKTRLSMCAREQILKNGREFLVGNFCVSN